MFGWFKKPAADPATHAPAQSGAAAAGGPSLQTVRTDPERLLKKLEWTVVRRLDGILQGDYRTLFPEPVLIWPICANTCRTTMYDTSTGT